MHYPSDNGGGQGSFCPLDNNHSHFILVEPGAPGEGDGPTELRLRLEKYISEQRTGYGGEAARGRGCPRGRGGGGPQERGLPGTPWWGVARVDRAEGPPAWAGTGIPGTKHARALRPGPLGGGPG